MSRRRRGSSGITTICWRDIPAQVTASTDEGIEKILLDGRFQVAIDRAAAVAGLTDTDDYVEQWRKVSSPVIADGAAEAQALAASLEATFTRERLEKFVSSGGLDPDAPNASPIQNSTEVDTQ